MSSSVCTNTGSDVFCDVKDMCMHTIIIIECNNFIIKCCYGLLIKDSQQYRMTRIKFQ